MCMHLRSFILESNYENYVNCLIRSEVNRRFFLSLDIHIIKRNPHLLFGNKTNHPYYLFSCHLISRIELNRRSKASNAYFISLLHTILLLELCLSSSSLLLKVMFTYIPNIRQHDSCYCVVNVSVCFCVDLAPRFVVNSNNKKLAFIDTWSKQRQRRTRTTT